MRFRFRILFEITDTDGIHQVQLLGLPTDKNPPPGYKVSRNEERNKHIWEEFKKEERFMLHSYQKLNGEKQTVVKLPYAPIKKVRLQVIDMHGNITWKKFDLGENIAVPPETP